MENKYPNTLMCMVPSLLAALKIEYLAFEFQGG